MPTANRRVRPKRTSPGRPEGESFAREDILNAAEATFAAHGFAGSSLREIAKGAHVTQALVTYYFGAKDALFKEVFMRRGRAIADERVTALARLTSRGKRYSLEAVVRAYLAPALAMRSTPQGRAFIQLQARMHTEPPRFAEQLRRGVYDEVANLFVAAIRKTTPHLSGRAAYWRMILVVGAYLYVHSDSHRLDHVSGGLCNPDDLEEMLEQITAFVVGGLSAPDPRPRRDGARKARPGSANLRA